MTVELWLWIGTIGMSLGMLLLFFPMQKNKSVSEQGDSIAHFLVPMVAMTLYLLMALGHGSVLLPSGRVFYFARYIDWAITTPLLLLSLVSGAVAGHVKKRGALIAGLVLSDVYMIVTGLVAGWTDDPHLKWWFYLPQLPRLVAIYALLWGPFKELSQKKPQGRSLPQKGCSALHHLVCLSHRLSHRSGGPAALESSRRCGSLYRPGSDGQSRVWLVGCQHGAAHRRRVRGTT